MSRIAHLEQLIAEGELRIARLIALDERHATKRRRAERAVTVRHVESYLAELRWERKKALLLVV